MKSNNLGKKLLIYIIGLFWMSVGSNLSIVSGLGVSPINSIPYAVSLITKISLGTCVTSIFSFYIVLQLIILRKDFKLIEITQVIFASIFGYFVSLTSPLVGFLAPQNYIFRLLILVVSIIFVALGVSLYLSSGLIKLPAEGLTAAIATKMKKIPFHTVKIAVDCTFVITALVLSLVFLKDITGVREGTVLAAIFVGRVMPYTNKIAGYCAKKLHINDIKPSEESTIDIGDEIEYS